MKRSTILILGASLAAGCASYKPQAQPAAIRVIPQYQTATASALAFDPPVIAGQPALDLDREGRSTEAFVGYDSSTATFFYLLNDDRQVVDSSSQNGWDNRYERRAISAKYGMSYR